MKTIGLVTGLGLLIGAVVQIFQWSLIHTLGVHDQYPWLIWLLPIAWIGFVFNFAQPALTVWVRTLWSHLFGASVGREGTALQISAHLAEQLHKKSQTPISQHALIQIALAAGLAAAYQAPWAGFIFALERGGKLDRKEQALCLWSSWLSFLVSWWLFPAHRIQFPQIDFDWSILLNLSFVLLFAGLLFTAPLYRLFFKTFEKFFARFGRKSRWALGGAIGLLLFYLWRDEPGIKNLGLPMMDLALTESVNSLLFVKKAIVTAIFCASGWFGGDFTPNMAIGAWAGNSFSTWASFPLPMLGAALGIFLPVSFTHRMMATGWVMTLEHFGWRVALIAAPLYAAAWALRLLASPRDFFNKLRGHDGKTEV